MVDGTHLIESCEVIDAFADHFQLLCKNHPPGVFLALSSSSEFLSLSPVSDSDYFKARRPLKRSKSAGLDNITGFVIKGCSDIAVSVLKHVFNLSLSQGYFRTRWKQAAVVSVFEKTIEPLIATEDPSRFLTLFPTHLNSYITMFLIILSLN